MTVVSAGTAEAGSETDFTRGTLTGSARIGIEGIESTGTATWVTESDATSICTSGILFVPLRCNSRKIPAASSRNSGRIHKRDFRPARLDLRSLKYRLPDPLRSSALRHPTGSVERIDRQKDVARLSTGCLPAVPEPRRRLFRLPVESHGRQIERQNRSASRYGR